MDGTDEFNRFQCIEFTIYIVQLIRKGCAKGDIIWQNVPCFQFVKNMRKMSSGCLQNYA